MGSAEMPKTGQRTWPVTDRRECIDMVQAGLEIGYRHIDTAQLYDNEAHVGEALNTADVDREEVFVATKLAKDNLSHERVIESVRESLERLHLDTLDLLYVHFPRVDYDHEWRQKRVNNPPNPAWKWKTSA